MSTYVCANSRTAEPRFGHMRYIGAPLRVSSVRQDRPRGHREFIGAPSAPTFDRQAEAVAEIKAERARRAAWAGCERRPLSIDKELTGC